MILIVGLGNPGDKYAGHRHNVGFMAADAIADKHAFGAPREKFSAIIREGALDGPNGRTKAITLKPQTFMNESGQAVGAASRFYKIPPEEIIVFYDELDLTPGKLRLKTGGGAAGHNGIRSIDAHIGNNFRRARIGIGHPGEKSKVTGHVLGNFAKADQDWLQPLLSAIASAAPLLAVDDQRFGSAVAQELAPPQKTKLSKRAENQETQTVNHTAADTPDQEKDRNPFAALGRLFGGGDKSN